MSYEIVAASGHPDRYFVINSITKKSQTKEPLSASFAQILLRNLTRALPSASTSPRKFRQEQAAHAQRATMIARRLQGKGKGQSKKKMTDEQLGHMLAAQRRVAPDEALASALVYAKLASNRAHAKRMMATARARAASEQAAQVADTPASPSEFTGSGATSGMDVLVSAADVAAQNVMAPEWLTATWESAVPRVMPLPHAVTPYAFVLLDEGAAMTINPGAVAALQRTPVYRRNW